MSSLSGVVSFKTGKIIEDEEESSDSVCSCGYDGCFNSNLSEKVEHPAHYTSHPSGVECITITRHYINDIGNAIKYLWRAGLKEENGYSSNEKEIEDLEKAIFYIKDRIKMLKGEI